MKRLPSASSQAQSGGSNSLFSPFGSGLRLCVAELGASQLATLFFVAAASRVKSPESTFETAIRISGQIAQPDFALCPKNYFYIRALVASSWDAILGM